MCDRRNAAAISSDPLERDDRDRAAGLLRVLAELRARSTWASQRRSCSAPACSVARALDALPAASISTIGLAIRL